MVRDRSPLPSEDLLRLVAPIINQRSLVVAGIADNGAGAVSTGELASAFSERAPTECAVIGIAATARRRDVNPCCHGVAGEQCDLRNHTQAKAEGEPLPCPAAD